MKCQKQNRPCPLQGRMSQEATKPGFSFLCLFLFLFYVLCCVRFCFSIASQEIRLVWYGKKQNLTRQKHTFTNQNQEIGLGKSKMNYFVSSGTLNLNQ